MDEVALYWYWYDEVAIYYWYLILVFIKLPSLPVVVIDDTCMLMYIAIADIGINEVGVVLIK